MFTLCDATLSSSTLQDPKIFVLPSVLHIWILSSPANPHKFARKVSCSCAYFTLQTAVIIEMKSQFKKYIFRGLLQ
jgi:hypothetical protein